jgi:signal transduction histidine kinase
MDHKTRLFFPIALAALLFVLLAGLITSYAALGELTLEQFIDIPGLLFVIMGTFGLTISRFSMRSMIASWIAIFQKHPNVDFFLYDYFWLCLIRNLLVLGVIGSLMGAVAILRDLSDPGMIAPSMAVMMLTVLYAVFFSLILPIPALFIGRLRSTKRVSHAQIVPWRIHAYHRVGLSLVFGLVGSAIYFGSAMHLSYCWVFLDNFSIVIFVGPCLAAILILAGKLWMGIVSGLLVYSLLYLGPLIVASDWNLFGANMSGLFAMIFYENQQRPFPIWLSVLFLQLIFWGMIAFSKRTKPITAGELFTLIFSFAALTGCMLGLLCMINDLKNPETIGPSMAIVILSNFYALLGFTFCSFSMEDKANLIRGKTDDLAISHILWFVYPIFFMAIMMTAFTLLFLSITDIHINIGDGVIIPLQELDHTVFSMILIWLTTFLIFVIGFVFAQFFLIRHNLEQLRQTQNQLVRSEKMASLGQLVAGVAHEINNPVNFIRSNIPHMKEYLQGFKKALDCIRNQQDCLSDPAQKQFQAIWEEEDLHFACEDSEKIVQSLEEGSDRIANIVSDLRLYSRSDDDYFTLFNIHEAIDSSLTLLHNRFKHHVTVHKRYGEIPLLECSPGRISQVFLNILSNAVDAIAGSGNIRIQTYTENERAHIEIRDDGKGIPENDINKIFDPFFTTKPAGAGTGLGLSISYGIIEQHRGTISVESEAGKGATFRISLPIKKTNNQNTSTRLP